MTRLRHVVIWNEELHDGTLTTQFKKCVIKVGGFPDNTFHQYTHPLVPFPDCALALNSVRTPPSAIYGIVLHAGKCL